MYNINVGPNQEHNPDPSAGCFSTSEEPVFSYSLHLFGQSKVFAMLKWLQTGFRDPAMNLSYMLLGFAGWILPYFWVFIDLRGLELRLYSTEWSHRGKQMSLLITTGERWFPKYWGGWKPRWALVGWRGNMRNSMSATEPMALDPWQLPWCFWHDTNALGMLSFLQPFTNSIINPIYLSH